MMRSTAAGRAQWDEPERQVRRRSKCSSGSCTNFVRPGNRLCDGCARRQQATKDASDEAKEELRETLLAWQRGHEELASVVDLRRHQQLNRAQQSLLDTLSPEAKQLAKDVRCLVIGSTAYHCADIELLIVQSHPVLVL